MTFWKQFSFSALVQLRIYKGSNLQNGIATAKFVHIILYMCTYPLSDLWSVVSMERCVVEWFMVLHKKKRKKKKTRSENTQQKHQNSSLYVRTSSVAFIDIYVILNSPRWLSTNHIKLGKYFAWYWFWGILWWGDRASEWAEGDWSGARRQKKNNVKQ